MSEYKRPISIIDFQLAIRDSSDEQLALILERLENSVARLKDSNELMESLMKKEKKQNYDGEEDDEFGPVTEDDVKIYRDSIAENMVVMNNQQERIEILREELKNRNLHRQVPLDDSASDRPFQGMSPNKYDSTTIPMSTDNDV
ncbi:hypothetical protein CAS74_002418 [Pichia kudriavzevii]|uniref:Translation machinery-associated protein 17 n=1 Tax=Pichia kudriavzevii TaxID=4909 RepID=A0A1V2LFM3_PICKU|nr:Translation machinery-associated protein 17 [Pichia kudriavzevii]OUT22673.1 hypothetical protein CAS74_002418 [Pichia kudriavzevii]